MIDFTDEERSYLRQLLHLSYESLVDLEQWRGQTLMSDDEIYREQCLIDGLMEKLSGSGNC